ncbi:MAG: hypothetical protein Q9218_007692 [Villophora microphyllina]
MVTKLDRLIDRLTGHDRATDEVKIYRPKDRTRTIWKSILTLLIPTLFLAYLGLTYYHLLTALLGLLIPYFLGFKHEVLDGWEMCFRVFSHPNEVVEAWWQIVVLTGAGVSPAEVGMRVVSLREKDDGLCVDCWRPEEKAACRGHAIEMASHHITRQLTRRVDNPKQERTAKVNAGDVWYAEKPFFTATELFPIGISKLSVLKESGALVHDSAISGSDRSRAQALLK